MRPSRAAPLETPRPAGFFGRTIARAVSSPPIGERVRLFRNILVHPTQEMRDPEGAFFRGGPEWPRFAAQVLARHCWGVIPRPVDRRPLPAAKDWPYFDPRLLPMFWPQLGIDPRQTGRALSDQITRLADIHAPLPGHIFDGIEAGIWCGPISLHFGHMIADFAMRIVGASRIDPRLPLVFSLPPFRSPDPPAHFWEMLDHLRIDRERVLLVRSPTRFGRLYVLPQAERPFGGGPSERHLDMMDAIAGTATPPEREPGIVFVSRAGLPEGRFAGEAYLEEALRAAGVTVFRPEGAALRCQLDLYRRARMLIVSEGSALHALQLLGRVNAAIVVLVRRPGNQLAAASLQPRAPSLAYLPAASALLYGSTASGRPVRRAGLSVLDDGRCIAGLEALGIRLSPHWDAVAYAKCRDADLAAWRMAQPDAVEVVRAPNSAA